MGITAVVNFRRSISLVLLTTLATCTAGCARVDKPKPRQVSEGERVTIADMELDYTGTRQGTADLIYMTSDDVPTRAIVVSFSARNIGTISDTPRVDVKLQVENKSMDPESTLVNGSGTESLHPDILSELEFVFAVPKSESPPYTLHMQPWSEPEHAISIHIGEITP